LKRLSTLLQAEFRLLFFGCAAPCLGASKSCKSFYAPAYEKLLLMLFQYFATAFDFAFASNNLPQAFNVLFTTHIEFRVDFA